MGALDRSAEKISRCSERVGPYETSIGRAFLACPGTGVVIERSDGYEIRNGPHTTRHRIRPGSRSDDTAPKALVLSTSHLPDDDAKNYDDERSEAAL